MKRLRILFGGGGQWMGSREYTGTFSKLRLTPIWKAKTERNAGFLLGLYFIKRSSPRTT